MEAPKRGRGVGGGGGRRRRRRRRQNREKGREREEEDEEEGKDEEVQEKEEGVVLGAPCCHSSSGRDLSRRHRPSTPVNHARWRWQG
eukprot:3859271-Pyramimonas_sp.AAC.1